MSHRLAAALAAVSVLAVPAAAQAAPALSPLKPCYVAVGVDRATGYYVTEDVHLTGTGFTPGALVDVAIDGATAATGVAVDANGALDTTVQAPFQAHGQRVFTATVTEQQNSAQAVSAQALVTRLEVVAKPKIAKPAQRIRFTGSGFTLNRGIYAHYVRRKKERKTVRLASRPDGACGTFSARRKQFPFRPRKGIWHIQIDQQKTYDPAPSTAFVDLRVIVKRQLLTGRPKRG